MENKDLVIEKKPYIITYSNHLFFEGRKLAFRKKELFEISAIPNHIKRSEQGWWFGKKLLSLTKAKELIKMESVNVDVSDCQWYLQENLNHVFNL